MLNIFSELDGNLRILVIIGISILLLCAVEKLGEWRASRRRRRDAVRVNALRLEMARGDREIEDRYFPQPISQIHALNQLRIQHQSAQLQYGAQAEEQ